MSHIITLTLGRCWEKAWEMPGDMETSSLCFTCQDEVRVEGSHLGEVCKRVILLEHERDSKGLVFSLKYGLITKQEYQAKLQGDK